MLENEPILIELKQLNNTLKEISTSLSQIAQRPIIIRTFEKTQYEYLIEYLKKMDKSITAPILLFYDTESKTMNF